MEEKLIRTCAIIGATPATLSFGYDEEHYDAIRIKKTLAETVLSLIERGAVEFISSLCEGVEMWGAEVCQAIRSSGSPLKLTCVPTNEEQANRWYPAVRERYFELLEKCTDVVQAHLTDEQKSDSETHEAAERSSCDDYIIDHSDLLLCVGKADERAERLMERAKQTGIPVMLV